MKKFIIVIVILLVFSWFADKKLAEKVAVSYQDEMNGKRPYKFVITRHEVWSERVGLCKYDVYIDYTANYLRLTSRYKVERWAVVDASRVSE